MCEAMVVLLRYVSSDWVIKLKVCRFMLLYEWGGGCSPDHNLVVHWAWDTNQSPCCSEEGALVNSVAMRTVSIVCNRVKDVGCFSHTLDHVGERIKTIVLDEFSKAWIGLFALSLKSPLLWRQPTGLSSPSYSPTSWWSYFEVFYQLHTAFRDLLTFLNSESLPPITMQ